MTSNGVSLYFALKNDPATKRDRRRHRARAAAMASPSTPPMAAHRPERHGVQALKFPNAAKAYIAFMMEPSSTTRG